MYFIVKVAMQLQGGFATNLESCLGFFHSPYDIAFGISLNETFPLIKEDSLFL